MPLLTPASLWLFLAPPQDAEKETYMQTTLSSLMDFFETLKGSFSLDFSTKDVACAELTWWIARRGNAKRVRPSKYRTPHANKL